MNQLNQSISQYVHTNTKYFDLDEMLKKNGIREMPIEIKEELRKVEIKMNELYRILYILESE